MTKSQKFDALKSENGHKTQKKKKEIQNSEKK